MEARLNPKSGNYTVWLDYIDINTFDIGNKIQGSLLFEQNGVKELGTLQLSVISDTELRELKKTLRANETYFCEGQGLIIVRNDFSSQHAIYNKDHIGSLAEKLCGEGIVPYWENRYCGFTGNKIFLYRNVKQG